MVCLQDLNLICQSSGVGAEIYLEKIPTSIEKSLELINSGDDYELCFTVDEDKYEELMRFLRFKYSHHIDWKNHIFKRVNLV